MKKKGIIFWGTCICMILVVLGFRLYFWATANDSTEMTDKYKGKKALETYTFGDYTVALLERKYEKRTSMGEAVFCVTKKGGKPEVSIEKDGKTEPIDGRRNRFGENGEFSFRLTIPGNLEGYYSLEGDKLFIKERFVGIWSVSGKDEKNGDYFLLVTQTPEREEKVWFDVSEPETAYKVADGTVYVSSMGARLLTKHSIPSLYVGFVDDVGKERTALDEKHKVGINRYDKETRVSDGTSEIIYTIEFDKNISVKKIKKAIVESRP
ncbi:MAG: hypothetical protein E7277_06115 [Lachnospiraceae bacterium]|nr:hypothetical protein [Lachnospiraceae bacterium]